MAIKFKQRKKSTRDKALDQVLKVLDPANSGVYHQYVENWAEFMRVELGAEIPEILDGLIETIRTNRVVVVPSATQMGKSWVGSMLALTFFKLYRESQVYVMAAPPKSNLLGNLLSKIRATVLMFRGVFKDDAVATMSITRKPDQFIQGIIIPATGSDEERETKFSGKHAPHMMVVMDEADAIPDFVFKAVDGWGSGGMSFHQVIFFNPKEKHGRAWELIESGEAAVYTLSAFDHPNVITGRQIIPGAVSQAQTVKRILEWTHEFNPDEEDRNDSVFEVPEFLVGKQINGKGKKIAPGERKVNEDNADFSYKVMGKYPAQSDGMSVPESWIEEAIRRYREYVGRFGDNPPAGLRPKMGFDIADTGSDSNCVAMRFGGFVRFIRWKGLNAYKAVNRGALLYEEYDATICCVDRSGVGAIAPGLLSKLGVARVSGIMGQKKSMRSTEHGRFRLKRDELMWGVREWLNPENGNDAMLDPSNKRLLKSLRKLKHRQAGDEIKFQEKERFSKVLGFSPDELDALSYTLTTAKTFIGSI